MIKTENDNMRIGGTKIYHYTAPTYVDEIISSGFIELEFHMYFEEIQRAANDNIRQAKQYMDFFRFSGRYVWFTTARNSPTAGDHCTVRFSFLADEIGAEKWDSVKKRRVYKLGGRAYDAMSALERTAMKWGENPDDWWVCRGRVPVTREDFDDVYRLPAPQYSSDEQVGRFCHKIKSWRVKNY